MSHWLKNLWYHAVSPNAVLVPAYLKIVHIPFRVMVELVISKIVGTQDVEVVVVHLVNVMGPRVLAELVVLRM